MRLERPATDRLIIMSTNTSTSIDQPKRLDFFERYLSLWVALCMVLGILLGKYLPEITDSLRKMEFGQNSHINLPIAILIWLMIYPMMLKIDFASIVGV